MAKQRNFLFSARIPYKIVLNFLPFFNILKLMNFNEVTPMSSCENLLQAIRAGAYDDALSPLYALDGTQASLLAARERAAHVIDGFQAFFQPGDRDVALFSGPGRTEIGGNHTDHQHGRVLCGSVDLDMLACAAPNGTRTIRIHSEGYPALTVELDELAVKTNEINTSAALVRGVASKLTDLGYPLSGFDAYATSTVLSGSGLSSSAAYEVLVGNILNHFCCEDKLDPILIAKIGQYAENVYFGKPCGLMDQMGSSVGGAVAIDFADPSAPIVVQAGYDFSASGHALCIVDTGSCHADLTDDYADIPKEMGAVAAYFGKRFLREVDQADFRASLPQLREQCGDRAVLRAMHFFDDDARAAQEAQALEEGDFDRFLALVDQSGLSSALHLQNTWTISDPRQQAIPLCLAVGRELLGDTGAIRVHGGGFAGTIQAFVPNEKLDAFKSGMEALVGPGKCHVLHIRPKGGCMVLD